MLLAAGVARSSAHRKICFDSSEGSWCTLKGQWHREVKNFLGQIYMIMKPNKNPASYSEQTVSESFSY